MSQSKSAFASYISSSAIAHSRDSFVPLVSSTDCLCLAALLLLTEVIADRYGNPTTRVVEEKVRELEGAEDCLVSSSGMNSATTMLLALVPAGGHIITTTDCYRRTRQFIQTVLPKMGVTATVLDPSDMGALERALEEHDNTSVYFSESPTNPYLRYILSFLVTLEPYCIASLYEAHCMHH